MGSIDFLTIILLMVCMQGIHVIKLGMKKKKTLKSFQLNDLLFVWGEGVGGGDLKELFFDKYPHPCIIHLPDFSTGIPVLE